MAKPKKPPRQEVQPQVVEYQVSFDENAISDLSSISDQATVKVILQRSSELKTEPLKQGKALTGDLKGYRSVRAAGQRYRIVYRVFELEGSVVIVVIGIRRDGHKSDAYKVAQKRLV